MFSSELLKLSQRIGGLLRERKETISVAEGSAGGLISASLLAIPGASSYYLGGTVIYTARAKRAFMGNVIPEPEGMRGATEDFARFLAESSLVQLRTTWAIGEAGAAGPANPYGDPAGHVWLAIAGPRACSRKNNACQLRRCNATSCEFGLNESQLTRAVFPTHCTSEVTKHVLTGSDDRTVNMQLFTAAALTLFLETLESRKC